MYGTDVRWMKPLNEWKEFRPTKKTDDKLQCLTYLRVFREWTPTLEEAETARHHPDVLCEEEMRKPFISRIISGSLMTRFSKGLYLFILLICIYTEGKKKAVISE